LLFRLVGFTVNKREISVLTDLWTESAQQSKQTNQKTILYLHTFLNLYGHNQNKILKATVEKAHTNAVS